MVAGHQAVLKQASNGKVMPESSVWEPPPSPLYSTLNEILTDSIGIAGALIGTAEGILVASQFQPGAPVTSLAEAETLAAMAAAALGLGTQFSHLLALGHSSSVILQGSHGCLAVQRVGSTGVLVVFGTEDLNIARLNIAVRQALPRLQEIMAAALT